MNWEFWIAQTIQFFVALGTIGAVVVALCGHKLRLRPTPQLKLELLDRLGEETTNTFNGKSVPSRWYHLKVTNTNRRVTANNVRVILKAVYVPDAAGVMQLKNIVAHTQMRWQHQEALPLYLPVGHLAIADLGYVMEGYPFQLAMILVPNNFSGQIAPGGKMRIQFVAVSDEADSDPLLLEVSWSGRWQTDADKMSVELVINPVMLPPNTATRRRNLFRSVKSGG